MLIYGENTILLGKNPHKATTDFHYLHSIVLYLVNLFDLLKVTSGLRYKDLVLRENSGHSFLKRVPQQAQLLGRNENLNI